METSTAAAALAAEPALTAAERDQARLFIEQARNAVIGTIKGVSEKQANFKPGPDIWSIAEILEHVVIVQERVLGPIWEQLAAAPAGPADRPYTLVDAIVINQFPARLLKFQGPPAIHPKGGLPLSAGADRLEANIRRLLDNLEAPELRLHVIEALPLKAITNGEHQVLDAYQWILAAAAHTERHAKQILDVKANPNFPPD